MPVHTGPGGFSLASLNLAFLALLKQQYRFCKPMLPVLTKALAAEPSWVECCPDTPRLGVPSLVRYTQEATNECINKWSNKLMLLSLLSSFSKVNN